MRSAQGFFVQQAIAANAKKKRTQMAMHFTTNHKRHNTYSKCVRLVFVANQSPSMAAPTLVFPQCTMLLLLATS